MPCRLPRRRVAHQHVEFHLGARRRRALPPRRGEHAAHVGAHGLRVLVGQADGRHRLRPGRGQPVLDDWRDELACHVVQHDLRSQQVRSAEVTAPQVGTVAGPAAHLVDAAAALDDRRVAERPLLRRERGVGIPARSALAAALRMQHGAEPRIEADVGTALAPDRKRRHHPHDGRGSHDRSKCHGARS